MSDKSYSASFLTEHDNASNHGDESEDMTIPDERNWKKDVENLKKDVGDFNITNYVKKVLNEEEQARFNKIMAKIPQPNRVYIQ